MSFLRKAQLYFHTLRYLRPIQIWGRAAFRFRRPKPDLRPAPALRKRTGVWQVPAARRPSMLSAARFRFHNSEHEVSSVADWDAPELAKLWRYNLHYFDDLNAEDASTRGDWHRVLTGRWVAENQTGVGVGWEPYPLSLRIVNWIKWTLAGNELDGVARHSLAVQVRYLAGRLEWHLLGNHLFANAKALVFAGCYFEGREALEWLRLGMRILEEEMPEQVLPDGGHFERSTMYHALAYEDLLDLVNLAAAFPDAFARWAMSVSAWPKIAFRMGTWLDAMRHPDGEIAFFNDAAIGVAPGSDELNAYARRLGLPAPAFEEEVVRLDSSGYVCVRMGDAALFIDVAPLGPDYLPGHAHADTLSYELSLFGQRVVVNSGTSHYGLGPDREWERSTAAHSTLEINGQNSSEVWAGFRVARRAYPFNVSVRHGGDSLVVEAAHDGYRRLKSRPVHRRRWTLTNGRLEVTDFIEGMFVRAVSRVYFHPDVQIEKAGAGGTVRWPSHEMRWNASVTDSALEASSWHPEFGLSLPNQVLCMRMASSEQTVASCCFVLDWS